MGGKKFRSLYKNCWDTVQILITLTLALIRVGEVSHIDIHSSYKGNVGNYSNVILYKSL
jgi:hypothetical protein